MKKLLLFPALALVLIAFSGCEDDPSVRFTAAYPAKAIDLSKKLGDTFTIINPYDSTLTETVDMEVLFDKTTRFSTIREVVEGDTLLYGPVSKKKGMYYVSHKRDFEDYYICAFAVEDNVIYGLEPFSFGFTRYEQSTLLREAFEKQDRMDLVEAYLEDEDTYFLTPDKKYLKKTLGEIIYDSTFTPLVIVEDWSDPTPELEEEQVPAAITEQGLAKTSPIATLAPNPAVNETKLTLLTRGEYEITIYDQGGRPVKSIENMAASLFLNTSDLKSGTYFVQVTDLQKQTYETVQLVKQ